MAHHNAADLNGVEVATHRQYREEYDFMGDVKSFFTLRYGDFVGKVLQNRPISKIRNVTVLQPPHCEYNA